MPKSTILRTAIPTILLLVSLATASCATGVVAQEDEADGIRFVMVMNAPGRDAVEFTGAALGDDCRLKGVVGGIETVNLLTGGRLYVLNPAIKTAREIDNPRPPGLDEAGWAEWLIEPGRVNPLSFAEMAGLDRDIDGEMFAGERDEVALEFEDGRLVFVEFPKPGGGGRISYEYSDFEADSDISERDFEIPGDFLLSD